ncbi:chemotaxis protein CheW [Virgibacillus halodenitrificans]|jgi:purine-binding chemotaxis protein CheW|uniref:Chemotaxis protein CheW n=2 Tax=Virgibacillus halodenitrificans TaxID=1482 RepID=A0AAC9NM06_VIRHA|nr:chemotaxis protein CheW [Virgibacillus halodenitrificans]APC49181.1 chemotaxis protein CheW [Virgibacillus halodenitrificans]CDQ30881.1 Coupling protein CheW [Virgibacillus halodenitrificans]
MMEKITKYIVFKLNNQSYGVNVQQIRSIERIQKITEVPRTSPFIKGVIYYQGETVPVLDLKERLQLPETETTEHSRFLIVMMDDMQVGLIVDAATEVIDIDEQIIEAPPQIIGGVEDVFLQGVAKLEKDLLIILDLKRVLDLSETTEVKEVIQEIEQEEV